MEEYDTYRTNSFSKKDQKINLQSQNRLYVDKSQNAVDMCYEIEIMLEGKDKADRNKLKLDMDDYFKE